MPHDIYQPEGPYTTEIIFAAAPQAAVSGRSAAQKDSTLHHYSVRAHMNSTWRMGGWAPGRYTAGAQGVSSRRSWTARSARGAAAHGSPRFRTRVEDTRRVSAAEEAQTSAAGAVAGHSG